MIKYNIPNGGEVISFEQGAINTPDKPIIPYIIGDGIGMDVTPVMKRVLNYAIGKAYGVSKEIKWMEIYAGQQAKESNDELLPQETIDAMKKYRVSIKGPLTTPVGNGFKSLNVTIRQKLDLYACVRPIRYFPGTSSPMVESDLTDMIVFRENTEDLYTGIEWKPNSEGAKRIIKFIKEELGESPFRFEENCGIGIKPVSKEGSERLIDMAIEYALDEEKDFLTIVHKGNIMKYTEGAFRDWAYGLVKNKYNGTLNSDGTYSILNSKTNHVLTVKDCIADNFLQQIILVPEQHEVIATLNLNGDYISDALAAQVGGIGIAPGANINYDNGIAIFEATHGTAPKYTGMNKVNPGSLILSAEMMLRHMEWHEAADLIVKGMEGAISAATVTYDFERLMDGATLLSCSDFGDAMISHM